MAEYINKFSAVDKLIRLENEFQHYKPFSQKESEMYRRICEAEIEIGKMQSADVAQVRRWIPVSERLPEKNKEVVGWYKDNPFSPFRYGIVSWNGHGWVFTYAQRYVDAVTYWMPLPEPPKEDE